MTTAVANAPVKVVERLVLAPEARSSLVLRQGAWVGVQATTAAVVALSDPGASLPELAALPVLLGAVCAVPHAWGRALGWAGASLGVALLLGIFTGSDTTLGLFFQGSEGRPVLHGSQLLAAALCMGGGLAWFDDGPRSWARSVQVGLALAATAGLGTWAGARLAPAGWTPGLGLAVSGAVAGLLACQTLVVLGLRERRATRVGSREDIALALDTAYRPAALEAADIDAEVARRCPDPDTRDGLGEVAAWVVRLQWTRQQLQRERDRIDPHDLAQRIANLSQQARDTDDSFTRDRLLASVSHLERLQGHCATLDAELARTAALSTYASVYLEDARTEVTLAQMQPGDGPPDELHTVLSRLRDFGAERQASRATRREVAVLG